MFNLRVWTLFTDYRPERFLLVTRFCF